MEKISHTLTFGGSLQRFKHASDTVHCDMEFAIFLPSQADKKPVPVLYWLSGLTCTDKNFMEKAGAHRIATELGIAIVAPDTSPRGEDVANDEKYDMGQGAGFYVNATETPWQKHYQMYDYTVQELPKLIKDNFNVSDSWGIAGHSMGGHGALMISLKNPDMFQSASAFSPICNPMICPWGQKAFGGYLGGDESRWEHYDSCALMAKSTRHTPTLVDQGMDDEFLAEQLYPDHLEQSAKQSGYPLTLNRHDGYDHSYYFIATFIESHLRFHHKYLQG